MVAVPTSGLPLPSVPLQTTKFASQIPAQTEPPTEVPDGGETVTRFVFEELKVALAVTAVPAEFVAETISWVTSPETSVSELGVTVTATILLLEEPPPHPPKMPAQTKIAPTLPTQDRMPPPRPHPGGNLKLVRKIGLKMRIQCSF